MNHAHEIAERPLCSLFSQKVEHPSHELSRVAGKATSDPQGPNKKLYASTERVDALNAVRVE